MARANDPRTLLRAAPAVLPVAAWFAGVAGAVALPRVSIAGWALVAALALAWGRRNGTALAALAAGVAYGAALWPGRPGTALPLDAGWPVHAAVRISEPWRPSPYGWVASGEIESLRQGARVVAGEQREVRVALPPHALPPPLGSEVRASGMLGRAPGFGDAVEVEPGPLRLGVKTPALIETLASPPWLGRASAALRGRVDRVLSALDRDHPDGAVLARGLVLGEESALPDAWRRALRRAGLLHLFAASGFNVSLLAGCVLLLAGALPRALRLLLVAVAIGVYVLLVGPQPAMLRAALMAWIAIAALSLARPPHALQAFALAGGGMLLLRPALIVDLGFQLTLAATAGLLLLAPLLARRPPPRWALPLLATAAAQIATLPWALAVFHLVSPLAGLANLLFMSWAGLALAGSLVICGLGAIGLGGGPGGAVLDLLAAPFAGLAVTGAGLWQAVPVAPTWPCAIAVSLAVGALALQRRWAPALLLAVALTALAWAGRGPARLEARFLDVGQGDAILLRDGGRAVLVDGGGASHADLGGRVLLAELAAAGLRRLDAVDLTHPDVDHCQGLADLLDYVPVREVWVAPGLDAPCATETMTHLGVRLRVLWEGDALNVGRWRLAVLNPPPGERGPDNDRSLVLRAEAAGMRVLLAGDIEASAELRLRERHAADLRVAVLKVAHHGSRTSSTAEFLAATGASWAVISVGRANRFGHPAPEALARLAGQGLHVLRTDRDGEVVLARVDGHWRISTPAAPR